jgi:hypothetical protein
MNEPFDLKPRIVPFPGLLLWAASVGGLVSIPIEPPFRFDGRQWPDPRLDVTLSADYAAGACCRPFNDFSTADSTSESFTRGVAELP